MNPLLLHNATLIDGTGIDPQPRTSVLVEDGIIRRVASADNIGMLPDARVVELDGMTLMPGLTDAHVHLGAVGMNSFTPTDAVGENLTTYALSVIENIELLATSKSGTHWEPRDQGLDGGLVSSLRALL